MTIEKDSYFDAIIVGGGAAGLTTAAFLAKARHRVLLIEKEKKCGGLISTFTHNGFTFDGGIRALESAGVLFPMLKALGIELDFLPNHVTVGIRDQVIALKSKDSLYDYERLLIDYFPENQDEITSIIKSMEKISHYMDIQYGIDNPLFLDPVRDWKYFLTGVIPWMFKYAFTVNRVTKLNMPVRDYLRTMTSNSALIDLIAQHFFSDTPAFFALSYLSLYLDYIYPKGGTGQFSELLVQAIIDYGGEIRTNTEVREVDTHKKVLTDHAGNHTYYQYLVWAADQQSFYQKVNEECIADETVQQQVKVKKDLLKNTTGNDSIFTTYIEANLPPRYFSDIASSHFFYTPTIAGDSVAGPIPIGQSRRAKEAWLKKFLTNTTYEIAIPALRDPALAPHGKTGLIISVLFDYALAKEILKDNWYKEFKELCQNLMIHLLDENIFPGLAEKAEAVFSSTPISIEKRTGNFQGAITGWSFTNETIPAEHRLIKIANSVKTPFPDVFQAGMWTYSPSGFPVALITGKLAADQVTRRLKQK